MPILDFMLPAANIVAHRDGVTTMAHIRDEPAGEPFDQMMTRALLPSESDDSTRPGRPAATPTVPGEGKQKTISALPQRRRIQTRDTTPEKAVPAGGETGGSPVQPQDKKSKAQIFENDFEKGGGDFAAGAFASNETPAASGSVPGFMVQFVTAFPTSAPPRFPPAVEKGNPLVTGAVPAAPSSSMAAAPAGPEGTSALVAGIGTPTVFSSTGMTLDPGLFPDKTGAELISSPKSDGWKMDTEAVPAASSSSMAAAPAGPEGTSALVAGIGTPTVSSSTGMTLDPGMFPDKTGAEPISSPKPDGWQMDTEAVPATRSSSMAAAPAGPEGTSALVAGVGTPTGSSSAGMTLDPGMSPDKTVTEPISSLKPDEWQSNVVKADDRVAGKTNPADLQSSPGLENAPTSPAFTVTDFPVLASTAQPAAQLPQNEASPSAELSVEVITPAQSETRGITAAKQYLSMKKMEKMDKVAGSSGKTEKVLPIAADPTPSENILPTADLLARISSRNGSATIIIGPSTKTPDSVAASATDGVSASSAVDLRVRALERTHDMVAMQAMRLVDSKLDSLRVVIKPGAGMQLSLEMHQRGDAIDAQVILQRGDFGHLSQHWPELQQRLEQRGIRLAPLADSENSATSPGNNGFQQPQRESANPNPLSAGAFAEFALASSSIQSTTSPITVTTAHRGWETWA